MRRRRSGSRRCRSWPYRAERMSLRAVGAEDKHVAFLNLPSDLIDELTDRATREATAVDGDLDDLLAMTLPHGLGRGRGLARHEWVRGRAERRLSAAVRDLRCLDEAGRHDEPRGHL